MSNNVETPIKPDRVPATNDYHHDARALLLKAAEDSGFLEQIAALFFFIKKNELDDSHGYASRVLIVKLMEIFDDHIGLPGDVAEVIWSKGEGTIFPDIYPGHADAAEFETFLTTQSLPPSSLWGGLDPEKTNG